MRRETASTLPERPTTTSSGSFSQRTIPTVCSTRFPKRTPVFAIADTGVRFGNLVLQTVGIVLCEKLPDDVVVGRSGSVDAVSRRISVDYNSTGMVGKSPLEFLAGMQSARVTQNDLI